MGAAYPDDEMTAFKNKITDTVLKKGQEVNFPCNSNGDYDANGSVKTFSIYKDNNIDNFKIQDFLLPNIKFHWKKYKEDRLRSVVLEPYQKRIVVDGAAGKPIVKPPIQTA